MTPPAVARSDRTRFGAIEWASRFERVGPIRKDIPKKMTRSSLRLDLIGRLERLYLALSKGEWRLRPYWQAALAAFPKLSCKPAEEDARLYAAIDTADVETISNLLGHLRASSPTSRWEDTPFFGEFYSFRDEMLAEIRSTRWPSLLRYPRNLDLLRLVWDIEEGIPTTGGEVTEDWLFQIALLRNAFPGSSVVLRKGDNPIVVFEGAVLALTKTLLDQKVSTSEQDFQFSRSWGIFQDAASSVLELYLKGSSKEALQFGCEHHRWVDAIPYQVEEIGRNREITDTLPVKETESRPAAAARESNACADGSPGIKGAQEVGSPTVRATNRGVSPVSSARALPAAAVACQRAVCVREAVPPHWTDEFLPTPREMRERLAFVRARQPQIPPFGSSGEPEEEAVFHPYVAPELGTFLDGAPPMRGIRRGPSGPLLLPDVSHWHFPTEHRGPDRGLGRTTQGKGSSHRKHGCWIARGRRPREQACSAGEEEEVPSVPRPPPMEPPDLGDHPEGQDSRNWSEEKLREFLRSHESEVLAFMRAAFPRGTTRFLVEKAFPRTGVG